MTKAPWTKELVIKLNQYQTGKIFVGKENDPLGEMGNGYMRVHPYTCPNRNDGRHLDNGVDLGCLVATENGWVCPHCDYRQDWAHMMHVQ